VREAVSSRRRGSMASEKCGMPTLPVSNAAAWDQADHGGQSRGHARTGAPCATSRTEWGTIAPPTPPPPLPDDFTSCGRMRGLLHRVIVRRAPAGLPFRPGALPARPWRTSTLAAGGQKPPGHHHPHHQNGHQYQNLPHGDCSSHTATGAGAVYPPTSGASASLRPPPPDGNSVRTQRRTHDAPHAVSTSPPTPARQHAILKRHQHKRPTLASEPL
jgi:hypothetical protein